MKGAAELFIILIIKAGVDRVEHNNSDKVFNVSETRPPTPK